MRTETNKLTELEKNLGYHFNNTDLLTRALTHSSFANESKGGEHSNERLEFLGDSVLSLVVAEYIFKNFRSLPEGDLTKLRASVVCEAALCDFSKELGVGNFLRLGKGEKKGKGGQRPSILADAFEAILAAIYLDGGMEPAKELVLRFVAPKLLDAAPSEALHDYKTLLQEIIQKNPEEMLGYFVTDEQGPDHAKSFTVEVRLNSNVIGAGVGRSKKAAEQVAAKQALLLMGEDI